VLVGRVKESYRCGGEMVMPKEVELALAEHPAVAEAHVVGLPDERMGEVGCACVVRAADVGGGAEELIEHCTQRLARFKVPRHVLFVDAQDLPLTVTGRVQKFKLAELARQRLATPAAGSSR
jgi:fatty-acyl-CoA synthase